MRRTCVVVFAIIAFASIAPSVQAALVELDQFNGFPNEEVSPNYVYGVGDLTNMAQTFTAHSTGYLDHIEIGNTMGWGLDGASPPIVEIRNTLGDQPGSTTFGSITTLSDPVPSYGWLSIYFPQIISIEAGDMYSIVLWVQDDPDTELIETVSVGATAHYNSGDYDYYAYGALWETNEAGTWKLASDVGSGEIPVFDIQFRTYVIPVPLPAGVWLGICAVGVAGLHLKRQGV